MLRAIHFMCPDVIRQVRRGVSASMFAPEEAAARELDIDLRRAVRILPHLQAARLDPTPLDIFFFKGHLLSSSEARGLTLLVYGALSYKCVRP